MSSTTLIKIRSVKHTLPSPSDEYPPPPYRPLHTLSPVDVAYMDEAIRSLDHGRVAELPSDTLRHTGTCQKHHEIQQLSVGNGGGMIKQWTWEVRVTLSRETSQQPPVRGAGGLGEEGQGKGSRHLLVELEGHDHTPGLSFVIGEAHIQQLPAAESRPGRTTTTHSINEIGARSIGKHISTHEPMRVVGFTRQGTTYIPLA